jgi:ATP-dependent helicase HrpA
VVVFDESRISFPEELPVSGRREEIASAISRNQVVIVAGETGSGKTTQLPKILLAMGRGEKGMIGHTQPRRIAARSVAERIAEELSSQLGDIVGYQVRFTDKSSKKSRVKVMTDGILLAELQHDRELRKYDTIIIDEAHERSLNIDFLLGYLKRLLPKRPELKVIITSATIDPERFSEHFGSAPIIEVSGRTHPVEIRYRPLVEEEYDDEEGEPVIRDQIEAIEDAVDELVKETDGDILVFLPGEREIRDAMDALAHRSQGPRGFDLVPLFSRLSAAEQHRVFERHTRRRVVLATNVAETSLTVPGIMAVIDTGVARISRYSHRTKVQRLPVEAISQASANQRSGRCGRIAPGIAIRLYSEEDFAARPEFTDPEILRTSLASVILAMASLRLGGIAGFPFIDPPDQRAVKAGLQLLEELGAIREGAGLPRLTGVGRRLARLPIDPRLGRMVLEADRLGCLREVLIIAAALSIQDPRERPAEHQQRADEMHARFADRRSDFMSYLNLWRYLQDKQSTMGSSAFRRLCRNEHLNHLRVREWQDFESQLRQVCRQVGIKVGKPGATPDEDRIHQALLSGLLSHVGLRDPDRRDYLGARGARFSIFPGSALFKQQPQFVMAAELVETSKLWGRQNAAIDPVWAEELGARLVKRSYADPHWSKKRESASANERVTLYGVPLVAERSVLLGRVDPPLAREMFIRHALVQGEWRSRHKFYATNQRLLAEARELEHRTRRNDLVVDEFALYDFYDARIPAEVVSGAHFDTWWKKARAKKPELLTFDPAMLLRDYARSAAEQFPTRWSSGDFDLTIDYHFEPGHEEDGATIEVPLAVLQRMDDSELSWGLPGHREELVTAMIKSLPKPIRVLCVPAGQTARQFLEAVPPAGEPLEEALRRFLLGAKGAVIAPSDWDFTRIPAHLRPTFKVIGEGGREEAQGKDLVALKEKLRPEYEAVVSDVSNDEGATRTGQVSWTFGVMEESFERFRSGHRVLGHPALDDEGESVGLVVCATEAEQDARHRLGVRRLLALVVPPPDLVADLDNAAKLAFSSSPYPNVKALMADISLAVLGDFVDERAPIRDEASFVELREHARANLEARARAKRQTVQQVLAAWRETEQLLHGRVELAQLAARTQMKQQLSRLIHPGFVSAAGAELVNLPRFLAAIRRRHAGLTDLRRDTSLAEQIDPLQQLWDNRVAALAPGRPPDRGLVDAGWLLEELRVSLWAQDLGTTRKVSVERVRKALG